MTAYLWVQLLAWGCFSIGAVLDIIDIARGNEQLDRRQILIYGMVLGMFAWTISLLVHA